MKNFIAKFSHYISHYKLYYLSTKYFELLPLYYLRRNQST